MDESERASAKRVNWKHDARVQVNIENESCYNQGSNLIRMVRALVRDEQPQIDGSIAFEFSIGSSRGDLKGDFRLRAEVQGEPKGKRE